MCARAAGRSRWRIQSCARSLRAPAGEIFPPASDLSRGPLGRRHRPPGPKPGARCARTARPRRRSETIRHDQTRGAAAGPGRGRGESAAAFLPFTFACSDRPRSSTAGEIPGRGFPPAWSHPDNRSEQTAEPSGRPVRSRQAIFPAPARPRGGACTHRVDATCAPPAAHVFVQSSKQPTNPTHPTRSGFFSHETHQPSHRPRRPSPPGSRQ